MSFDPTLCPVGSNLLRSGHDKAWVRDRLRCSGSPETRGTIGGDRNKRSSLVMRLDDRRQTLGGAAGGYERSGRQRGKRATECKERCTAFLEKPPDLHVPLSLRPGQSFQQGRIPSLGADHELPHTCLQACAHCFNRDRPCIVHVGVLSGTEGAGKGRGCCKDGNH